MLAKSIGLWNRDITKKGTITKRLRKKNDIISIKFFYKIENGLVLII
jgi:hypothetical protein